MGVEVSRVLRDGFYDADQRIIKHVKESYGLDHMGSGIESGIRILIFKLPHLTMNETMDDWATFFQNDLIKVFPDEKFT